MTLFQNSRRGLYLLSLLLFILSTLVIWIRTSTVKGTYLYVQKEKELRRLEQDIQASRVRWLKLTTPKRLESIARGLGLKAPEMSQVLKYQSEHGGSEHAAF
jgi:hypothetical protein